VGIGNYDGVGVTVPPRRVGFDIRVGMQTHHVKRNFGCEIQRTTTKKLIFRQYFAKLAASV
jgi:hypothetical protein